MGAWNVAFVFLPNVMVQIWTLHPNSHVDGLILCVGVEMDLGKVAGSWGLGLTNDEDIIIWQLSWKPVAAF